MAESPEHFGLVIKNQRPSTTLPLISYFSLIDLLFRACHPASITIAGKGKACLPRSQCCSSQYRKTQGILVSPVKLFRIFMWPGKDSWYPHFPPEPWWGHCVGRRLTIPWDLNRHRQLFCATLSCQHDAIRNRRFLSASSVDLRDRAEGSKIM